MIFFSRERLRVEDVTLSQPLAGSLERPGTAGPWGWCLFTTRGPNAFMKNECKAGA